MQATHINHVTLIVDDINVTGKFYEEEFGLEPLPAFTVDFPTAFYKINDTQQLHLTQWKDVRSFRGHLCLHVDDFNRCYFRMKELGIIDIKPFGKVRTLPEGAMQMFVRDPSGNLIEISSSPHYDLDPRILEDEYYQDGMYDSGRNDYSGFKSKEAKLYHSE